MSILDLITLMADRRYPDPGFNVNYLALFLAAHGWADGGLDTAAAVAKAQADLEGWSYGVTVPPDAESFLCGFREWTTAQGLIDFSDTAADAALTPRRLDLLDPLLGGQREN